MADLSQYMIPNDTPVAMLDCEEAFNGLSDQEKLYAFFLAQASFGGGLIVLFQTSPESPGIFLLFQRVFRDRAFEELRNTATANGVTEEEFQAFLVYAAAFYSNMGNYKSFGDTKFIPALPKTEPVHTGLSSRCLFFIIVTWATVFVLVLMMIVGHHVTSLGKPNWPITVRETSRRHSVANDNAISASSSLVNDTHPIVSQVKHYFKKRLEGARPRNSLSESSKDASEDVAAQMINLSGKDGLVIHDSFQPSTSRFRCTEGRPINVVFIKVHKSGSTTVANLLARYALRYDLNVALPNKPAGKPRFNYFSPHRLSVSHTIPLARNEHYHVLFNHMIYNRSALDCLMPKDTFYCGIMREPLSRFLSAVNYYHSMLSPAMKQYFLFGPKSTRNRGKTGKGPLPEEEPSVDLRQLLAGRDRTRPEWRCEMINSLACDTGLPATLQSQHGALVQHALQLDRQLDLMMVMEHFHESLVLFKRRACLSTKDIVYIRLNSAKRYNARRLSESDQQTLRTWQAADHYLYDFFYKKFQHEVKKEGETFWQEVDVFRKILNDTQKFCIHSLSGEMGVLTVPVSRWNEEFILTAEDCELMQLKEVVLQRRLINRAWRRWNQSGQP